MIFITKEKKPKKAKQTIEPELQLQIIKEHIQGVSFKKLEQKYNISDSAIVSWYKKYQEKGEKGLFEVIPRGKKGGVSNTFWDNSNLNFITTNVIIPIQFYLYIQAFLKKQGDKTFSSFILEVLFKHHNLNHYDDIFFTLSKKYDSLREEFLIDSLNLEINKYKKRKSSNSSFKQIKKVNIKPPKLIWNFFTLENYKNETVSFNSFIISLFLKELNFNSMEDFFMFIEKEYKTVDEQKLKKILETK